MSTVRFLLNCRTGPISVQIQVVFPLCFSEPVDQVFFLKKIGVIGNRSQHDLLISLLGGFYPVFFRRY